VRLRSSVTICSGLYFFIVIPASLQSDDHIGQTAQRQAVNALKGADFEGDGAQNWAHSQKPHMRQLSN
jgi:hypothetical protein